MFPFQPYSGHWGLLLSCCQIQVFQNWDILLESIYAKVYSGDKQSVVSLEGAAPLVQDWDAL